MGFLSGLGRMFRSPSMPRQPRIMDYGKPPSGFGWDEMRRGGIEPPGPLSLSPVSDQPYLQGPSSLGQEPPMGGNPMESLFGGSPSPDWSQAQGMGKPGGGFNIGQAAQGIQQMMGQQEQQMQPYQPSWFGQFQPFGRR